MIENKPTITYAPELMRLVQINCTDSMKFVKSNFTAKGIEAVLIDKFDNQLYRLTIEPMYERKE
jgi:hypothetical protein